MQFVHLRENPDEIEVHISAAHIFIIEEHVVIVGMIT
jgi:hypothetical protein